MKEIIEKYKKGELSVAEFYAVGLRFDASDKYRNLDGAIMGIGGHSLGDHSRNIGRYVVKSAQLDKEITAMEKQPEYEYVNVKFKDDYEHLKLMIDGEKFYTWDGEVEYSFNGARFIGKEKPNHCANAEWTSSKPSELYRRVEITPEQKREREVEGLGRELLITYEHCNGTWQDKFEAVARDAIEWMESKK